MVILQVANSVVFLTIKVWNPSSEAFLSCCATVNRMDRSVFVLPREKTVDGLLPFESFFLISHRSNTGTDITLQDIWQELDSIMTRHQINNWTMQKIHKKYAFEVPNVPSDAEWIEVTYPFSSN